MLVCLIWMPQSVQSWVVQWEGRADLKCEMVFMGSWRQSILS